jgi:hypothetical protein
VRPGRRRDDLQLCRERLFARAGLRAAVAPAGAGGAAGPRLHSRNVAPLVPAGDRAAAARTGSPGRVRYLFRLGHAGRSARYATSIAQLVVGLAPVMGWGPVPHGRAGRARFVRSHRRSVQRWLNDLEAAGLVVHEPERDGDGSWWRTQIVLLAAPEPSARELAVAVRRARRWRSRERARRRRARIAPSLGAIRARSGVPSARTRAQRAVARRVVVHKSQRRAAVDAQIAAASACRDLAHPFGAPPPSAPSPVASIRSRSSATSQSAASSAHRSLQADPNCVAVVAETGASAPVPVATDDFEALAAHRLAARQRAVSARAVVLAPQVEARVAEVTRWPAGRRCPLGRLREAWVAHRYGLAKVVDAGTALAGAVRPALPARVLRAIELY